MPLFRSGKREGRRTLAEIVQVPPPSKSTPPAENTANTDNRPHVQVTILGENYAALIDTGAVSSFVGDKIAALCGEKYATSKAPVVGKAKVADGRPIEIRTTYNLPFRIENRQYLQKVLHLPRLLADMVLGADFLIKHSFLVDCQTGTIQPKEPEPRTPTSVSSIYTVHETDPFVLTPREEKLLRRFLDQELPLFEQVKGTTPLIEHTIHLTNPEPIKQRYRPRNPRMQEVINLEVDKMLAEGIIEPSDSAWSSPVVLPRKKDGQYRFCIDFQKVNEVSKKDAYPLPFINSILDKLRRARYISSIDLRHGYWQVPLSKESKPITAFTVPSRGLYQFRVMPFGLHSAPATFQRLMDKIIGPDLDPYCFAYLDDIVVLGDTFEHHLEMLREVFRRLRNASLKLNPDKCQFCRRSLRYLGHVITAAGIQTDPEKVSCIQQLPAPTTVRSLRRFLGMASWYRRFIPEFSKVAAPLNQLLKKDRRWVWKEEQDTAFRQLKQALTQAPVLACPDFTKRFILQTDASDDGLGIALTQHLDGGDHVIAYASRSLSPAEKSYTTTEKECLAIVWGIEKMRPYLEGYKFTVITDHQSLRWLQSLKNPTGRLARWALLLQQYDFDVKYRRGVLNRIADALSRDPIPATEETPSDTLMTIDTDTPDSWYQRKLAEVEQRPDDFPDFCIRDGRLYRHIWDLANPLDADITDPWKLCVPKAARGTVLRENHDEPTAGHMGIAKTTVRIAEHYYWPGMFRDIAKYVRRCESCQRYKQPQQLPPGKMQPSRNCCPWETVSTDLVGPLPRSSRGNSYLAVFQDRFTKWVQCRAIRKATATAVTKALYEEIIVRFGCPRSVITDNGTQYTGRTFRNFLSDMGISHRLTPPYTPQANPVERTNKTLKTMIAQYCSHNQRHWDVFLPELSFAINTARHSSTGFSPAFLNFGRELEVPKALYRATEETTDDTGPAETEPPSVGAHTNRMTKLHELYNLVKINLAHAFSAQSRHYNLRHRDWRCHVGDLVMRKQHPLSSAVRGIAAKLEPKYFGPYTVIKVRSPVVYDIRAADGKKLHRIHVKDLKPANPPDDMPNINVSDYAEKAAFRRTRRCAMSQQGRTSTTGERDRLGRPSAEGGPRICATIPPTPSGPTSASLRPQVLHQPRSAGNRTAGEAPPAEPPTNPWCRTRHQSSSHQEVRTSSGVPPGTAAARTHSDRPSSLFPEARHARERPRDLPRWHSRHRADLTEPPPLLDRHRASRLHRRPAQSN